MRSKGYVYCSPSLFLLWDMQHSLALMFAVNISEFSVWETSIPDCVYLCDFSITGVLSPSISVLRFSIMIFCFNFQITNVLLSFQDLFFFQSDISGTPTLFSCSRLEVTTATTSYRDNVSLISKILHYFFPQNIITGRFEVFPKESHKFCGFLYTIMHATFSIYKSEVWRIYKPQEYCRVAGSSERSKISREFLA